MVRDKVDVKMQTYRSLGISSVKSPSGVAQDTQT
jgi:hypothetical protein